MLTKLEIPTSTIIKLLFTALIVYCLIQLSPLLMLLFMAVLLAVTLEPLVLRIQKWKAPRWLAILIVTILMIGCLVFVSIVILPPLIDQISGLSERLPQMREEILAKFPPTGILREAAQKFLHTKIRASDATALMPRLVAAGQVALSALSEFFIILIFAVYFLIDGQRLFRWVLAFFPGSTRAKLKTTAEEISEIMFAYIAGQIITSLLCSAFAFTVLSIFKVPAALMLALLAGAFDVLPILGFFISTIPTVLLAFFVSGDAATMIFILYVVYHAIENYIIVPKVYGNRLRLSTLTVLIALLAATALAGIPGAIIALPIVASYPIIERVWLVGYLGEKVIEKHEDQKKEFDPDAK